MMTPTQTATHKRIQSKFHAARKIRRKAEIMEQATQAADAASVPQLRRQVNSLRERKTSVRLPDGILDDVLHQGMDYAARDMATQMRHSHLGTEPWIHAVKDAAMYMYESSMRFSIFRGKDNGHMDVFERHMDGDYGCTLTFPQFTWTHTLDRAMLRSIGGKRTGPVFVGNDPVYFLREESYNRNCDAPQPDERGLEIF